jgi:hypothetical protein
MFRSLPEAIAGGVRWLLFSITVLAMAEELVRVVLWVARTWGPRHALTDGAVLYKLGEAAILLPFLFFVHLRGSWGSERSAAFTRRARRIMWAGGLVCAAAWFDLTGRVPWAWWCLALVVGALVLPIHLGFAVRRRAVRRGHALATMVVGLMIMVNVLSLVLVGSAIAPLPASFPAPAAEAAGRWQQDLDYLAENLELLHVDVFHAVPRERFVAEVAALRTAIPALSPAQVRAGFHRIVALVGDGHTRVLNWNAPGGDLYPIRFEWLADGLYVTAAPPSALAILGRRVVRLGAIDAEEAFARVATLVPAETGGLVLHEGAGNLSDVGHLAALGIADPGDGLRVTATDADGDTLMARLVPGDVELIRAPPTPPAYRSRPDDRYWSEFHDGCRTAYLKYDAFVDPVGFPRFADAFWDEIERRDVRYVIVDLRDNGGGVSAVFSRFYERLAAHDGIGRTGHLYVLVNRRTFSSAVDCAAILRRDHHALLAGEEMGGDPNACGDRRQFRLPNSRALIGFSTRTFAIWPDTRPPFAIDLPIQVSARAYLTGGDPALDEVLARIRSDLATAEAISAANRRPCPVTSRPLGRTPPSTALTNGSTDAHDPAAPAGHPAAHAARGGR